MSGPKSHSSVDVQLARLSKLDTFAGAGFSRGVQPGPKTSLANKGAKA